MAGCIFPVSLKRKKCSNRQVEENILIILLVALPLCVMSTDLSMLKSASLEETFVNSALILGNTHLLKIQYSVVQC